MTELFRETTGPLLVWDVEDRVEVTLEPGRLLSQCRVHQNSPVAIQAGAEVYDVAFQVGDRHYYCPLFRFQPRTQTVDNEHLDARTQEVLGSLAVAR